MHITTEDAMRLLHSQNKEDRARAAAALAVQGDAGIQAAVPLLSDTDWHLRYRAAEIIGLAKSQNSADLLLPLLKDEKDHVRYMAVKSLGLCSANSARSEIEKLQSDENPFVQRITKQVLADLS